MIANVLTIAGSDCGGGAGIQADLKTFSAFKTYGLSIITALTAQNTLGVQAVHVPPIDFVNAQLNSVFSDIRVDAVKIGMTVNAELIKCLSDFFIQMPVRPFLVIDPVMVSTSGDALLEKSAVGELKESLLPLADVITPNLAEAGILLGEKIHSAGFDSTKALLSEIKCHSVLLKGGHDKKAEATDYWVDSVGNSVSFAAEKVDTKNTHGTGCTLSAAIAASYASAKINFNDASLSQAIQEAKTYVTKVITHADSLSVGSGSGPLWHQA